MKSIHTPFLLIVKHFSLLRQTTVNDIRARFAGSVFGLLWVILYPFILLGAYSIIYIFIFQYRFGVLNSHEYVALIFCGLIPYLGFSEALGIGVPSVVANSKLIKNSIHNAVTNRPKLIIWFTEMSS